MAKQLKTHVDVLDKDDVNHGFPAGAQVPAWARKAITNPDVWADDEPAQSGPEESPRDGPGSGRDERGEAEA